MLDRIYGDVFSIVAIFIDKCENYRNVIIALLTTHVKGLIVIIKKEEAVCTMKALFDRIQQQCIIHNTDFRQVEKICGLSRNAIDKWENGTALIENVLKVARHFDISVDYLIGYSDNPKSHREPDFVSSLSENFSKSVNDLYTASSAVKHLLDVNTSYSQVSSQIGFDKQKESCSEPSCELQNKQ